MLKRHCFKAVQGKIKNIFDITAKHFYGIFILLQQNLQPIGKILKQRKSLRTSEVNVDIQTWEKIPAKIKKQQGRICYWLAKGKSLDF